MKSKIRQIYNRKTVKLPQPSAISKSKYMFFNTKHPTLVKYKLLTRLLQSLLLICSACVFDMMLDCCCCQVSRMLPGGLFVLGIFIITDSDDKDSLTTLRQVRV